MHKKLQAHAGHPLTPIPSPPFPRWLCTFCFSLFHSAVNVFIAVKLVDNAPRMQKGSRAQLPPPPSPTHTCHTTTHVFSEGGLRGQRLPLWAAPSCSFLRFCILRPTLRPRTALPSSNMNNMNTNNNSNNNNNTNNNSNKENKYNNNENENNNRSRASPIAAHRSCSCFWSAFCLLIFPLSCSPSLPLSPFLSPFLPSCVVFLFRSPFFLSACLFGQHVNLWRWSSSCACSSWLFIPCHQSNRRTDRPHTNDNRATDCCCHRKNAPAQIMIGVDMS